MYVYYYYNIFLLFMSLVCNVNNYLFLKETMQSGISMVRVGLCGRGIIVPCQRVLDFVHRVNPLSQLLRRRVVTYHHEYSVPAPNSLWCIKIMHKLYWTSMNH